MDDKTKRNIRVQSRYDELMQEGRHGHYETMFRVVREEVEAELARLREQEPDAWTDGNAMFNLAGGAIGYIWPVKQSNAAIPLYLAAPPAQPDDLIPQDALFVCGQMGAHVTRVRAETAQPVQRLSDERIDEITRDKFGTKLLGVMIAMHREYARSIEAALQPQGWVSVPMEPTPGMVATGAIALIKASDSDLDPTMEEITTTYRAMIAARPGDAS